ncbi:MAG: hypothetical protein II909_03705 [Kiritimatiellae bacterium]|nr:hypothetical protein [Kiritimatiellia bacterium]
MRKGQIAIYLVLVLVTIALAAVMNVTIFVAIRAKNAAQNIGDEAAATIAAEQGKLINEIGRLNLAHMRGEDVELEQRRLCLLGPLRAYAQIQPVAKEKDAETSNSAQDLLKDHLERVIQLYSAGDPYMPSYEGAWNEYAQEISLLINNCPDGFYAAADNIEFYGLSSYHMLCNRDFYDAILSHDWCWFHFNAPQLLTNYSGRGYWGSLDFTDAFDCENSEIFNLHLAARRGALTDVYTLAEIEQMEPDFDTDAVSDENATWFFFSGRYLREWSELKGDFPVVAPPRPEYDHLGCGAIIACSYDGNEWLAAAKPLGTVDEKGLVLPRMSAARLIPLDGAPGANLHTADADWIRHLRHHLKPYLGKGDFEAGCGYCKALRRWEHESFRKSGVAWLKINSGSCRRGSGGSMQRGGAYGH